MNLELIINNIRAFIVVVDRDMNIVYSNRGDKRTRLEKPALIEIVRKAFANGRPINTTEMHLAMPKLHSEGLHEVDVCVKGEYTVSGGAEYVVLTITDITQLKKERNQYSETIYEARNEAVIKTSFLANMSHEIRTPLNAILGFSKLLMTSTDQEHRQKYCSVIETNIQLLQQLIEDVLDMNKIEAGTLKYNFQKVDVNEVLEAVRDTVKSRVQSNVVLNMVLGMAELTMVTDRERLSQVLINMLTNACKFTNRGSITFGYELNEEDEIYFYVKDTGMGISKENQEKLFKRYGAQTDRKESVGLGLAICKNLVTTMNGKIGCKSAGEGRGSTFWFTLPLQQNEEVVESAADGLLVGLSAPDAEGVPADPQSVTYARPAVKPAPVAPEPQRQEPPRPAQSYTPPTPAYTPPVYTAPADPEPRQASAQPQAPAQAPVNRDANRKPVILIAEDNDSNYMLFESILEDDYTLYHALDGSEAVEMFPQVKPDLVLMDISMPHMDGYEATSIIRKIDTNVPIIAVTAYAFASDRDRIMSNGFNAHVSKPINADRLVAEIERLLY